MKTCISAYRVAALLVASIALVANAETAHAGICSGQPDGTTCDAGSDAPYTMVCLAGSCVACTADIGAAPQFIDNGNGTITDRHTCLVWEKKDNAGGIHDLDNVYQWSSSGSAMDGSAFTVFIANLNTNAFAGHKDWRVPTAAGKSPATGQPAEIESIEVSAACGPTLGACMPSAFNNNCGPYSSDEPPSTTTGNPGCTVDGALGTPECSCAPFFHSWSASTVGGSPSQAWLECYTVTANGLSAPDKMSAYNVRAVRGGVAPAVACPSTPLTGCFSPGKSTFTLASNPINPKRDKLTWSWSKGDAVAVADLGDPTATTDYTLCVYAQNSVLVEMTLPPGGLWRTRGRTTLTGYRYVDRAGSNSGIKGAGVTSGIAAKSKAFVHGGGADLPAITLPLTSGQLSLTVQLSNNASTPKCWTANYTNAPSLNGTKRFRVRLP